MRTYPQAVAFAESQRRRPTRSWYQQCQNFARQCVGAAPFGGTALAAWRSIPTRHRHTTTPRPGSLVYFDDPNRSGEAGHVVLMVDAGYCYSNDILRAGKIDKVPLSLIRTRWRMRQLGWIDWTPSGSISLKPLAASVPVCDLSLVQLAAAADPFAAQGHVTTGARPSVVLLERALVGEGLLGAAYSLDGSYGKLTRAAYAKWQARAGSSYRDGRPRLPDLTKLASRHGFRVVA